MQAKGTYTKGYQARSESTPAARTSGPAGKAGPVKSLSVKKKDSEDFINITGLFESIGKKGNYLGGTNKETQERYYVFTNIDKQGEIKGYSLMHKDMSNPESKLEKIADLKSVKSKAGNDLLVGESASGDSFYVNDAKKKA